MPNSYYSSNNKLTGGALFATFDSKNGAIYFKLLKQIANNPNKKGNFDGKNPLNVKLSQDEAADIVRAVRTNSEAKFYHKFDDSVTTGNFKYYSIPANGNFPAKNGFGLTIKKTLNQQEIEIKIGFTLGSAERLSLFLQNALVHCSDAEHAEDVKQAKLYAKNKEKNLKSEYIPIEEEKTEEVKEIDF